MDQYITRAQLNATITQLRIEFGAARQELVDANARLRLEIMRIRQAVLALQDMQERFLSTTCARAAQQL